MTRVLQLLFLISATLIIWSRVYAESIDLPSIAVTEVHIINATGWNLKFSLRPVNGEWREYTINGQNSISYECSQCEEFEIYMKTTGQHFVQYRLMASKRYFLQWVQSRKRLDVVSLD